MSSTKTYCLSIVSITTLRLLLLISLPVSGGSTPWINKPWITSQTSNEQNMDQINFISPQQSLSQSQWHSAIPVFNGKGMDHLYLITEYVVNFLQPHGLPDNIIKEELLDDPIPILQENKGKLISHFWGLILTAIVIISVAIVLPLIGCFCCCCCSSDNNSRRAKHSRNYSSSSSSSPQIRRGHRKKRYKVDRTCDPCVRSLSAVKLFVLLLLLSFFVICAFVTNEYIRTGVHKLPKALNQTTDDMMLYLNNTQIEVNTLLRTNYDQLAKLLGDKLDRSGVIVKDKMAVLSEAVALNNLTDIASNLKLILNDLKTLSTETNELRLLTVQLQSRLSRSRNDLEQFLDHCRDKICSDLRYKYNRVLSTFVVTSRIDELPDLSHLMNNISRILDANIVEEIRKGKQSFDEISYKLQSTVNNTIPDIKRQIYLVGLELSGVADDINYVLRRPFVDLNNVKSNVYLGEQYINKYEIYCWYAFLLGTSILFIILMFYSFGLLCGSCKEQPTRHNYKWRSKSSTRLFRCGLTIFMLTFLPLVFSSIVLFLMGSISDKTVCYYLENPSDPQSKQIADIIQNRFEKLHYSESFNVIQGVKPNFADVITRCHQNLSLFNVLQLNRFNEIQINGRIASNINISEILQFKDRYKIDDKLQAFLSRVNVNPSNVQLMTRDGYQLLQELKETSLGTLNFSSYANVIKHSITPLDLVAISNELEQEANKLPKQDYENVAKLRNIAMDLKIPINLVIKIKETIDTLTLSAEKIEKKSIYGNIGVRDVVTILLRQLESAQDFIATRGRNEIRDLAANLTRNMSFRIDQYANHVIDKMQTSIGRCEPVSRAINSSVMALCKETVLPFNGYWFSMLSSLVILFPSTFFSYILSHLYQRVKRFSIRRESDSTLDNLEEDDIPLAHLDNKSHSEGRGGPAPSAPPNRTPDDDNWSPGSLPPHLYGSRPPPYNFVN
ncbi:prominin-1-like [Oppia nitens]|uniref:prominin-1-like n=1 Tax=Oppia nitens TaxID=1686743 RepID=UPI0023DB849D|nr:prominin-1-like [Oppia nitens]XP_054154510.1 prominin-1-like [Oppia nitens]